MKLNTRFSLTVIAYLVLTGMALLGLRSNVYCSSGASCNTTQVELKAKADITNQEDLKTDLLMRF